MISNRLVYTLILLTVVPLQQLIAGESRRALHRQPASCVEESNPNETPALRVLGNLVLDNNGLTEIQILRMEEMTTFFENSTVQFQYGYIENIGDGRGYTAGRVGFCTGTGDLIVVTKLYCGWNSKGAICPYLPRLNEIDQVFRRTGQNNGDVSGLNGFSKAWQKAAKDPLFRKAQDEITQQMYFDPAIQAARQVGLHTALGKAIIYDTMIQHGDGGTSTLIARTQAILKFDPRNEVQWLNDFLDVRRAELLHPEDPATQEAWSESVDRVDKLRSVLNDDGNLDLSRRVLMDDDVSTD